MANGPVANFTIALNALSGLLDKGEAFAAAKKVDPSVLLGMRLAPDMFPMSRQVQIACDLAKNGFSRLAGAEAPRFEDNETTFAQLKDRIARTVAYLGTLDAAAIAASSEKTIVFPMGPSRKGEMKGSDYLSCYIAPNVYFHITTAYAIMRHAGVDVGKMDYLAGIPITIS
jgi:hypothetical protein